MLTLRELTRRTTSSRSPALKLLNGLPGSRSGTGAVVDEIVVWDEHHEDHLDVQGALVIAPLATPSAGRAVTPPDVARWTDSLQRGGAVGVVAVLDGRCPDQQARLERLAASTPLPVLAAEGDHTADEVEAQLLRRQREAERRRTVLLKGLADRSAQLTRSGKGPEPLLQWLRQTADATVLVLDDVQNADLRIPVDRELLRQVSNGRRQDGTWDGEKGRGPYVLVHRMEHPALSDTSPRPVLVASRLSPWHPQHRELIAEAAAEISHLRMPASWRTGRDDATPPWHGVRQSGVGALMTGDVAVGRRLLAPLYPALITAQWMRTGVIRCAPGLDREAVRSACECALGGAALVALSPVRSHDLLVMTPAEHHENREGIVDALRPVLTALPGGALMGISSPAPLRHAAPAYFSAVKAMTPVGERLSGTADRGVGAAREAGTDSLAARLLSGSQASWARTWARAVLANLSELDAAERQGMLRICTLALTLGPVQASQLLQSVHTSGADPAGGVGSARRDWIANRDQLAGRLAHLQDLTGLGPSRTERAVLHLALEIEALADGGGSTEEPIHRTLEDVLNDPAALEWRRDLFADLSQDQLVTLALWFGLGTDEAAATLERDPRTIRNRMQVISAKLGRSLTEPPWAGLFEVVLALAIPDPRVQADLRSRRLPFEVPGLTLPDPAPLKWRAAPSAGRLYAAATPLRWSGVVNAIKGGDYWYPYEGELLGKMEAHFPARRLVDAARDWRHRVVAWAAERGVRQWILFGCGLPSKPFLHESSPHGSRWIYADADPAVRAHFAELLPAFTSHHVACTDFRPLDPEETFGMLEEHGLDLSRPVAVFYGETSHTLTPGLVARTSRSLAPGSLIAVSKLSDDPSDSGMTTGLAVLEQAGLRYDRRSREEMISLFQGLELAAPGVVRHDKWHPELADGVDEIEGSAGWFCGVGVVRGGSDDMGG